MSRKTLGNTGIVLAKIRAIKAPAKVQAALPEALEERQVTVAGTTQKTEPLFIVMAIQNPVEQKGTYPLPEARMDRLLVYASAHRVAAMSSADSARN